MKSAKTHDKLLIACIALISVAALLKAGYFEPDFFPIGLTCLTQTSNTSLGRRCPYGNADIDDPWVWQENEPDYPNGEDSLIYKLGVNCIGCEPAYPYYMVSFGTSENNYLYKVCKPSFADNEDSTNIYLILSSYYTKLHYLDRDDCDTTGDTCIEEGYKHMVPSAFFGQSNPRWAPVEFHPRNLKLPEDSFPNCLKTPVDNGLYYEGTPQWQNMVDTAMVEYDKFLDQDNRDKYIWGFNLLVENPALSRKSSTVNPWHGVWKAAGMVLEQFRDSVDEQNYDAHPMIIAKGGFTSAHRAGHNIFETLPDIDAFLIHTTQGPPALWNYGEQKIFDQLLYCSDHSILPSHEGRHYDQYNGLQSAAIYFQKYGNTPHPTYPEQKRRWMAGMWMEWRVSKSSNPQNPDKIRGRRPCPPEIRCLTYLNLSRGAKGMFFVCWSGPTTYYSDTDSTLENNIEPYIAIPVTDKYTAYYCGRGIGLRNYEGYPFGYWGNRNAGWYSSNSTRHRLNDSTWTTGNHTYWHDHNWDTTYNYLAHSLIPEIKAISAKLMQLDWINGYSLNSTDSEWRSPGPHYYVEDVWGVEYMDVAFFDHSYEPIGVEYFMMVNREGIADMTNRTVSVALDAQHWPEEDTLILTDIANADTPRKLTREGKRYVFTEVFEPGEGKLYRVAPR